MSFRSKMAVPILIAALFTTVAWPVMATPQDEGDFLPDSGADAITSLMTVQERLDAIGAEKGEAEAYLVELDTQLTDLTKQLNTLQQEYSEKRAELDLVTQQLQDAEAVAEKQRKNMALRIQYIYENSMGTGYLDAVFSSDNFQDILNRATNIQELSVFDREMLEDYLAVCDDIELKRAEVEKEQKEIQELEDESVEKRTEIQTIYEETLSDIEEMAASIEEGHGIEAQLLEAIQEQEAQLAVLFTPAVQQVAYADYAAQTVQPAAAAPATDPAVSTEETGDAGGQATEIETSAPASSGSSAFSWDGPVLTRTKGVNQGPTGKETYYNLNMSGVVNIMRNMGNTDEYWVRDDGVKMLGDYVMVAANLEEHPRGSIVDSSLGTAIVVDTGYLSEDHLDIAVAW